MTQTVGINLLWCIPAVVGGTEEYAVRTTKSLLDRAPEGLRFVVFANRTFADVYPEFGDAYDNCELCVAEIDGRSRPKRVWYETKWLRDQARAKGVELLHHVGGTIPALRPVSSVLTLHDLQPLALPGNFSLVKRYYLRAAIPRSVRRAEVVIAPSDYVRSQLLDRFALDPAKAHTVSAGYDLPKLPEIDDDIVPADVRRLIAETEPYFVYPAITHHHKDHATAIRAVAAAKDAGYPVRFVLTGGSGQADVAVGELIAELGLDDLVVRLGRVDREVLELLVAHAEALLFPSRFEGFGIPVLEAMALGCPVIASDATALPEVVGDSATLLEPGDVDAWSKAIIDRVRNTPDRTELVARGRHQATRFAWTRSGERLEAIYRQSLA